MTSEQNFDVAVIGGGPGGYVTAIRASQEGKRVALIEKGFLGGSCLNVGCIPTKALLSSAHLLMEMEHASQLGIEIGSFSFDFAKMVHRKQMIVESIRKSLEGLILSNGVTIIPGNAKFESANRLLVESKENLVINADHIVIATGSSPRENSTFPCDHDLIRNSTSILTLTNLPKSLAIIGGGYIGCEFATLFSRLGVEVTIIETLDSLLCHQEKEIRDFLTRSFERRGISVLTKTQVEKIEKNPASVKIFLPNHSTSPLEVDMVLCAVGRQVETECLDLQKAKVAINPHGCIPVNDKMQTNIPHIYAVGDVTGKWMLAHVASHQGIVAADSICGKENKMTYNAIPAIIYTYPEIASVGLTLKQAEEQNISVITGKFPFKALGKSVTSTQTEGFAYLIADRKTEKLLGAHIIGEDAGSLIGEMALAIQNGLTLSAITHTLHAHPSLPEALFEAALMAKSAPLHLPPLKKTHG